MSSLEVPYANGMRLGQGFNTYMRSICLDNAVTFDASGSSSLAGDARKGPVSQTVEYTSRLVNKMSDVADTMNISAALSIKLGGVTAAGSGAYMSEDKIRDSDINFVVKVHVVNQITPHTNSAVFRPINGLPVDQFNSVYGDAFISGFAEGGEFIAIISITAKDKSTVQSLKGTLEIGYAGISAIGGARLEKTEALVDSETNVSVSWCGGGPSIAAATTEWDIDSALQAAAAFPSHCAQFPQRITALLTRYEALPSYRTSALALLNPPKYDNVTAFTSMLLDDFMDFKALWKQAKAASTDLDAYVKSETRDAYELTKEGMDTAVMEIRGQMEEIEYQVDELVLRPEKSMLDAVFGTNGRKPRLTSAHFARRLPVQKALAKV